MPTTPRSRTGSSRTKKPAGVTPVDKQPAATVPRSPNDADNESGERTTEVTAVRLERREIPSFSESRAARIAEAAYWRAERRGFVAGQELDDWLAAEKEIDGENGDQPPS